MAGKEDLPFLYRIFKPIYNGYKAYRNLGDAEKLEADGNSDAAKEKRIEAIGNISNMHPGASKAGTEHLKNSIRRIPTAEERWKQIEEIEQGKPEGKPVSFNLDVYPVEGGVSLAAHLGNSQKLRQNLSANSLEQSENRLSEKLQADNAQKAEAVSVAANTNAAKPAENKQEQEEAAPNTPSDDFGMA